MDYLNIDIQNEMRISLKSLIGESIAILGIKGSGKTNTAAVLIEELLTTGLPLTIVDIEGEYWGLKEKYEVFVIGRSANVDVPVDISHAEYFAEFSVVHGVSLILDLSEFSLEETQEFLLSYFNSLWHISSKARRPYQIILEEAHEFVPQSIRTPLKDILSRIALRGRKRGLGLVIVSQRSAKVEKDVLTQAAIVFLHRVVHPIDMKVYQELLPLQPREVEAKTNALRPGDAIVMSNNAIQTVRIRARHTFHAGMTPELKTTQRPKLRNINNALLSELKKLTHLKTEDDDTNNISRRVILLETEIAKRDEKIASQQHEIEKLRSEIDLLSKLEVTIAGNGPIYAEGHTPVESSHIAKEETQLALWIEDKTQINSSEIARQQKRYENLLVDVRKLPRFQRAILVFLTEREDTTFTTHELARWLDISISTIENRPPLDFIKMGLLKRQGKRGSYNYVSSVRSQFKAMFPDIDTDYLVDRLVESIK